MDTNGSKPPTTLRNRLTLSVVCLCSVQCEVQCAGRLETGEVESAGRKQPATCRNLQVNVVTGHGLGGLAGYTVWRVRGSPRAARFAVYRGLSRFAV